MRRGLNTLNFLSVMEECHKQIIPIFQPSCTLLSAVQMEDLFHIKYSDNGSDTEEQIVINFFRFLRDIEEGISNS